MTCSIPGMCSGSPDCSDLLCPGRPVTLHRVAGFIDSEGGKSISGGHAVTLARSDAETEPKPWGVPDAQAMQETTHSVASVLLWMGAWAAGSFFFALIVEHLSKGMP